MRYFNDYGPPYSYSDALYHSGIPGMKWGVRRFQNLDRTWTEEGKIRYGSASRKAGETVAKAARSTGRAVATVAKTAGRGVKGAGKFAVKRFKMKHPWAMTDDEVREYVNRMANEKKMIDAKRELSQSTALGKTRAFVSNLLLKGAATVADAGFRKLSDELTKNPDERRLEELERSNKILKARKDQKKLVDELAGKKKESVADLFKRMQNDPNSLSDDDWERAGAISKAAGTADKFATDWFGKAAKSAANAKNASDASTAKKANDETTGEFLTRMKNHPNDAALEDWGKLKTIADNQKETKAFIDAYIPPKSATLDDRPAFGAGVNSLWSGPVASDGDSYIRSILDDTPMSTINYYNDFDFSMIEFDD